MILKFISEESRPSPDVPLELQVWIKLEAGLRVYERRYETLKRHSQRNTYA